jgi:hypothetical protein
VITLVDDDRSETYSTLDEAITAARLWYYGLAGNKLPAWSYRIGNLQDFRGAVRDYKAQVAEILGCSNNRLHLRVEAPAGAWFSRNK